MTKTIASIYPLPLSAKRPLYMGVFNLPAVPRGSGPFLLEIKDHVQVETEPWFKGMTAGGRQKQTRITVTGEEIAADLMNEWAEQIVDSSPDCRPGVWIVRDSIPVTDMKDGREVPAADAEGRQIHRSATKEECAQMFAEDHARAEQVQANYAEKAFLKGNVMADNVKAIPFIPQYCRTLSTAYGHTPTWLKRSVDVDVKKCPACMREIARGAWKCGHCQEIVDPQAAAEHRRAVKQAVA